MAKKKKKKAVKGKDKESRPRIAVSTLIGRFALTAAAVLVLVYVAALVIPRTDGFRYALEERSAERWGFPITIEGSSMTPGLLLKLTGIALAEETDSSEAGFRADEAHVTWCPMPAKGRSIIRTVTLVNPSLTFMQAEDGSWQPSEFAKIGQWMDKWLGMDLESLKGTGAPAPSSKREASGTAKKSKESSMDVALEIRGGRLAWRNQYGQLSASANDIDAGISPVTIPSRAGRHIKLNMDSAQIPSGKIMRNVVFEMMSIDANQVLLGFTADWSAGIKTADRRPQPAISQDSPVVVEADVEDIASAIRKALHEAMDE